MRDANNITLLLLTEVQNYDMTHSKDDEQSEEKMHRQNM
jgi:hypothetical protein